MADPCLLAPSGRRHSDVQMNMDRGGSYCSSNVCKSSLIYKLVLTARAELPPSQVGRRSSSLPVLPPTLDGPVLFTDDVSFSTSCSES